MTWFQRRRQRKQARNVLQTVRHARRMRGDIADPKALAELKASEERLRQALRERADPKALEAAAQRALTLADRVLPRRRWPGLRENVEVITVAFAVAFAFRTYFIQPFSIPTGSMQPTLYGITVSGQTRPGPVDYFPLSLLGRAVWGERYVDVRAKETGYVHLVGRANDPAEVFPSVRRAFLWHFLRGDLPPGPVAVYSIGGQLHCVHPQMTLMVQEGQLIQKGALLAAGRVRTGDHVFVNKILYNVRRPRRGDIVVFNTEQVEHPQVLRNSFYIKRLVGLPGETIAIDPPNLVVDGNVVREPPIFNRLVADPRYQGYQQARASVPMPVLADGQQLKLGDDQFLLFGDNTMNSLDGRYFGAIDRNELVAPAFFVYWPLGPRWGLIRQR